MKKCLNRFTLSILLFFSMVNSTLSAQNSTCAEALLVDIGTHEVASFTGDGAIFQGATSAAWYRYEPTEQGSFMVSSCDGGGDTRLVVMLLDDCANQADLQIINSIEDNCADGKGGNTGSTLDVLAVPGFSYVIYWDNGQSSDPFTWQLSFAGPSSEQNGETCATARIIEEGTHEVADLAGVGTAFLDAVSAQWYAFTPERDGALFINSCESGVNTRLFVWEGECTAATILAQDDNGCGPSGASDLSNVIVAEGETYYIYWDDHYTDEGFTFDLHVMDPTVSTNEQALTNKFNVYPNPVEQQFFVEYNHAQNEDMELSIFNGLGQRVKFRNYHSIGPETIIFNVADLENGLYFLRINIGTSLLTKQFIVQN